MIWIREHSQKRKLRNVAPQTILSNFPDVQAPEGSYIIFMQGSPNIWKPALFNRARELGQSYPQHWPWSWPLYYIMKKEKDLAGAEVF